MAVSIEYENICLCICDEILDKELINIQING